MYYALFLHVANEKTQGNFQMKCIICSVILTLKQQGVLQQNYRTNSLSLKKKSTFPELGALY